ncbi:aspartyl protease family protein 2 [Elaeis guineensis]|uniref:Aspartyl protease family protein 2 n=1 Tax=Elaeis guineensis var. tenera TaxID=51953 RepID=A0A6I9RE53_ELAGV|nr:aspartyl protease family protein 2 [Elaeis guineensis]
MAMAVTIPYAFFVSLLAFLLIANGASKRLEYQTLVVTPLRPTPALLPDDDFLTWTSDSQTPADETDLSPAGGGAFSSSFHVSLAHRDSLLAANTTPEHLLRLRLGRDAARVANLHKILAAATAAGNATHAVGARPRGFSASVVSGLSQGSGEYFTRIGIGTPARYLNMVLDTGSDVVWLQCAPCRRCYSQTDPIFDPRQSRSYAAVPCEAPLCRRLDVAGCDTRRRSCLYLVSYGDGSITTGEFSTETLTFRGGVRVARIALGCGHDNEGLFVAAAGLLGLGQGSLSFPSQAGRRFGHRFSYCLVDRTSSGSAASPVKSSLVVFGDSAVPRPGAAVAFTPMLRNPKMDTFYYVELTGISVGGSQVAGVSAADLRLNPATGKGGVIVDSGTSVTRLVRPAYAALRDAFKAGAAELREAPGGFSLFDTCYNLAGKTEVKVPTVVMHLGGGASVPLPAENYLIPVDTKGTFCFAFAGTESGVSIIGNIQQQGFRVVFDGARSRVGFLPRGC